MSNPGDSPGLTTTANDRFVALFTAAPIGIALTDVDGTIVEANPALGALLGTDAESLRGTEFANLAGGQADAAMLRVLLAERAAGPDGRRRIGVVLEHAEDGPMRAEITLTTLPGDDPAQNYPVVMVEDVNDLHLLQEQLHHQNVHDPLTGLPNAASFHGRLETAMVDRAYQQVALTVFDIDGFRVINDGFGSDIGDQLLRRVAAKLRAVFPADAVVARLTGDGFGVLLRGRFSGRGLTGLVDRALEELNEPVYFDGRGIGISASAGIVVRDVGSGTATDLEQAAAITLHRAKQAGRAQWVLFDPEFDRDHRERLRRGAVIGGALETGQFELMFHPTVRPDGSDEIVVVQTDLRWNHPQDGPLRPAQFLPLADATGMSLQVGKWMLTEALSTVARWRAELGPSVPDLSVRLPTRLAIDQDLVGLVRKALDKHDHPAHVLCLSTTAATVLDPRGEVLESLSLLGELGVQIDLLVTGASDLDIVLNRMLKVCHVVLTGGLLDALDDSLSDADADAADAAARTLADMIALPQQFGVRVAAEGVRTRAQADRLAGMGVIAVRGEFLHGAMSVADAEALLGRQVAAAQ